MGENLKLTASDGFTLGAYRATPSASAKGAVVVVQEIFGVNSHIRSVCDGYADAGYLAIAPALYDRLQPDFQVGYTPDDIAAGRDLKAKANLDDAIRDVAAAAEATATGGKVGIVGYCWGGLVAYVAACRLADQLTCASSYYGGGIVEHLGETPAIPLIMHFGALDQAIPQTDVAKIGAANPDVTVYVYEGADHGFNCDQRQQHNAEAAALARGRTLDFFAQHLG